MSERFVQITNGRFHPAEYERDYWAITCEVGTTREDILQPHFWSHVAKKLKPYSRIEVRIDDGTFFGEYLVLQCDRTWAKVKELSFHSLTSADVSQTESEQMQGHRIEWKGPQLKHCIIRNKDNAVIKEGISSKKDAQVELDSYVSVVE